MAGISGELEQELRRALNGKRLPSGFADAIARALQRAGGLQRAKHEHAQRRDAVKRLVKAGRTLQGEIKRANAAYGVSPTPSSEVNRQSPLISVAWLLVSDPLNHMVNDALRPWLTLHARAPNKRGNPHEGRSALRIAVLGSLQDAGVPISKSAQGLAAKVLRAVLEDADRRDGIPARPRASFNGSQWGFWVAEFRYIEQMCAARVGTHEQMSRWIAANPPPRRSRSGK